MDALSSMRDPRNKNTALVIGNGFDLNLGFKTDYCDFIESDDFKALLQDNALAQYLHNAYNLKNWIDIEAALPVYSQRSGGIRMSRSEVKEDFMQLKKALTNYLLSINTANVTVNSFVTRLLDELLHNEKLVIINFNYTSTFLLMPTWMNSNRQQWYDKIYNCHGQALNNNIVFGVEDNADIKKEHVFLRKACQYDKPVDVNNLLTNKMNVFFIGHSLGKSDYSYFEDFFYECSIGNIKDRNLYFTYYDESGLDSIYAELDQMCRHRLSELKKYNSLCFLDVKKTNKFVLNKTDYEINV